MEGFSSAFTRLTGLPVRLFSCRQCLSLLTPVVVGDCERIGASRWSLRKNVALHCSVASANPLIFRHEEKMTLEANTTYMGGGLCALG